jgi:hypothetical protein
MGIPLSTLKLQLAAGHHGKGGGEEATEALHIIEKLVRTMKHQFVKDFP